MIINSSVASESAEYKKSSKKISRFHKKLIITAGMGFFTDAYDLFIIGVVTAILSTIWHLSITQLAILNGASLASAGLGAIFFGHLADRFGRKKMYGIEIVILVIGAILSALSPNFTWLLLARICVGFGIGGDYPSSAVIVSEHSDSDNRGLLVLLVFAMQAVGLIVGPLIASVLLAVHVPDAITWRILLGLGAIPAASVFFLRRSITESSRYLLDKQSPTEVSSVIEHLTTQQEQADVSSSPKAEKHRLFSMPWIKYLVGTAGAWFLLDVAFYGNGVSSTLIMKTVNPSSDLIYHTLLSALLFLVFAVPAYFLAASYVDRIGRKRLQIIGFSMMAVCYLVIAYVPGVIQHLPFFVLIFGISFFFVNFGPNTTTFLIPSEIYPSSIRASAHGLSAAIGKLGAFLGALLLPIVLHHYGIKVVMMSVAIVALIGIVTTFLVPEMSGEQLDSTEISKVSYQQRKV